MAGDQDLLFPNRPAARVQAARFLSLKTSGASLSPGSCPSRLGRLLVTSGCARVALYLYRPRAPKKPVLSASSGKVQHPPQRHLQTGQTYCTRTAALPASELKALQPAIDLHFGQPNIAAIRASLASEQRPEFSAWAQRTIEIIDNRSPLAMAVTQAMLLRGAALPLADCFAMELHIGRQWFEKGNIMEGVRALIVDKDKQPRWQPPHIDQLDAAVVEAFFDGLSR